VNVKLANKRSTRKIPARGKSTAAPRRTTDEIRHRLITSAAAEFRKFGFAGATTAAIARGADTTEAQLFRAFDSKVTLFREAVFEPLTVHLSGFMERYLADVGIAPNAREQARRYICELQQFMDENSLLLLSLVAAQSFGTDDLGREGIGNLQTYFRLGAAMMRKRVVGPASVDPDILVRVSFAAVMGCVVFKNWVFPGRSAEDTAISAGIIDFVIDGINANFDPEMRKS
jgi:AcrR family transcriptional regulator